MNVVEEISYKLSFLKAPKAKVQIIYFFEWSDFLISKVSYIHFDLNFKENLNFYTVFRNPQTISNSSLWHNRIHEISIRWDFTMFIYFYYSLEIEIFDCYMLDCVWKRIVRLVKVLHVVGWMVEGCALWSWWVDVAAASAWRTWPWLLWRSVNWSNVAPSAATCCLCACTYVTVDLRTNTNTKYKCLVEKLMLPTSALFIEVIEYLELFQALESPGNSVWLW